MKKNACSKVQELIAWEKSLSKDEKLHILDCSECFKVQSQFDEINSVMTTVLESEIPTNFTSRVMAQIHHKEPQILTRPIHISKEMYYLIVAAAASLLNILLPMSAH